MNMLRIMKNFRSIVVKNMTLKVSQKNNCCLLKNGSLITIENISHNSTNVIIFSGKKYLEISSFFNTPCNSSDVGYFLVTNNMSDIIQLKILNPNVLNIFVAMINI